MNVAGKRGRRSSRRIKRHSRHGEVGGAKQSGGTSPPQLHPFRSLFITIGVQIAAFLWTTSLTLVLPLPLSPTLIHLVSALILARLLALTFPWQLCNALIPIGLLVESGSLIPLSLLVITLLIFGPTLKAPIPFYPTRRGVYQHLADAVVAHSPYRFVDLGSGFGSVLFALAHRFPTVSFLGYETGLIPLYASRVRGWWYRNISVYRESFWKIDLRDFDLIYAFLAPPPMTALEEKLSQELNENALFISNSFPLPHSSPFHTITVGGQSLLFYRRSDIRLATKNDALTTL